jgi:uncharacterized protein (DUF983 family)
VKNYFKKLNFSPEVTHGICPTCSEATMLISLTKDHYRCVTCGTDLEQKVNGVIKYILKINISPEA